MRSVQSKMISLVLLVIHSCAATIQHHQSDSYGVLINLNQPINVVDERFLSVTIDFGVVRRGFSLYDLQNPRLLTLVKALSPAYLRLGGTAQDFMTFQPNGTFTDTVKNFDEEHDEARIEKDEKKFNMTGEQLDQLLKFITNTKLNFFIGLNVFLRNGSKWNSANAKVLLDYVNDKHILVNWELGNEPPFKKFNLSLSPDQLYQDFKTLRKLLTTYPLFRNSLLVGPDIGQFRDKEYKLLFYDTFIKHACPLLDAVSWHQYYTNGRTATVNDFIDPDLLDELKTEINVFKKITRNYSPSKPIWLGETSSTYGGGTDGLSNRFVAGFMWLDKLGLSAKSGVDIVMRQSLFNGHYALLSDDDFQPYPDYWLSLIFRNLVGERVLKTVPKFADNSVRIYAHCTSTRAPYARGAIVIFALNLLNREIEINDGMVVPLADYVRIKDSVDQFLLTPADGDLVSRYVLLNGVKLEMPDRTTLPSLKPLSTDRIVLPKLSFGFFVMKHVTAEACL